MYSRVARSIALGGWLARFEAVAAKFSLLKLPLYAVRRISTCFLNDVNYVLNMRRLLLSMRWSLSIFADKDISGSEDISNISRHVEIENYKRNGGGDAVGNR